MVSPAQQPKDLLFFQATSRYSLHAAWMHVKPRLEKSKDDKVRSDAALFALNVQRSVNQLQQSLRASTFKFEAQKGVLKKRKAEIGQPAKDPRPIVVAPARNRIVQRAILDVCQSSDKAIMRKLGNLVDVVQRQTSVGGLPGRGVPEAIDLIKLAMNAGATWFVRSDLKNFFQAVPKHLVRKFLDENVTGPRFNNLFMDALATELSNVDEVRDMMRLFPMGNVGVPQGSSLSALCANIVLSDFDLEFNRRGVVTVRYLDDFIMLGKGRVATERAFKSAEALLKKSGFECHDPFSNSSKKAASGEVGKGFEFLSFNISPLRIAPTRVACGDLISEINSELRLAKAGIQEGMNGRRTEPRYVQTLAMLDRKIRGWGDAFRPTTDRLVFDQLDERIRAEVEGFEFWFAKFTKGIERRQRRRAQGIALLFDTPAEEREA